MPSNRGWSTSDLDYLRKNWRDKSDEEMAQILGRSAAAVKFKRSKLQMTREQGVRWVSKQNTKKNTMNKEPPKPELDNMTTISQMAVAAQECGMQYGKYCASTPEEIERARAEYRKRQKEERRNPWAMSRKV